MDKIGHAMDEAQRRLQFVEEETSRAENDVHTTHFTSERLAQRTVMTSTTCQEHFAPPSF